MKTLIDPRTITQLNHAHAHVDIDLRNGDDVPTLMELKRRQVRQAEADLMVALNKLLTMYAAIEEQAVAALPNVQLTRLMRSRGIKLHKP